MEAKLKNIVIGEFTWLNYLYLGTRECKAMCSVLVLVIVIEMISSKSYIEASKLDISGRHVLRCNLDTDKSDDESDIDCSVEIYDDVSTKPTSSTPRVIVIPRGPFYDFVVNICQTLLHHFSVELVPGYFNVLNKCLRGLGSGRFMKHTLVKFAKRLKKISDIRGELLRMKVQDFLDMISSGTPMINEFFHAMNAIYSVRDDNKMDDYIYLLKQFGKGHIHHIGDRTRWTFERIIFDVFYKQKEAIQTDIKIKFQSAYIEYMERHKNSS